MKKKSIQIILGVVGAIILLIIIDLVSVYTRGKPILAVESGNVYKGIFYDTYLCSEYAVPQIKRKGSKFSCSVIKTYAYTVETIENDRCANDTKLYYGEVGRNIYLYCLDDIKINDYEESVSLRDYYQTNNKVITEIINSMEVVDIYKDGGSKKYIDEKKFSNNGLGIIECNTIDGNKDIYIGPKDIEYQSDFCLFDTNMSQYNSFIRTYQVMEIKDNSDEYVELTVSQFQGDSNVKVKVRKDMSMGLEKGKNYEFVFQYTDKKIEDKIEVIFANAELMSINETNKVGLEQVQDKIMIK